MGDVDRPPAQALKRRWLNQTGIALGAAAIAALGSSLLSTALDDGSAVRDTIIRDVQRPGFIVEVLLVGLLFAPVVETAVMGWIILLLLDRKVKTQVVLLISAFLWAAGHVALSDRSSWLLAVPFFVFSYVFIVRNRGSNPDGFIVASMTHFYYNVSATIVLIASVPLQ